VDGCEGGSDVNRIGAEFEITTKMERENESENDHLCKMGGYAPFCKNDHFSGHS
jgi:hypothetical protein